MLLVSHPVAAVQRLRGLRRLRRKNPGKLNVSHAGNGTLPHVTMELLMVKEHMQVTNVPYRGAAPALADLVAGQVQAKLDTYTTSAQFVADKRLNALAVTSAKRLKQIARRADGDGERAGLRGLSLDGHRRARRHAAAGDRQARRGGQARRRAARRAGALRQGRASSRSATRRPSSRP